MIASFNLLIVQKDQQNQCSNKQVNCHTLGWIHVVAKKSRHHETSAQSMKVFNKMADPCVTIQTETLYRSHNVMPSQQRQQPKRSFLRVSAPSSYLSMDIPPVKQATKYVSYIFNCVYTEDR